MHAMRLFGLCGLQVPIVALLLCLCVALRTPAVVLAHRSSVNATGRFGPSPPIRSLCPAKYSGLQCYSNDCCPYYVACAEGEAVAPPRKLPAGIVCHSGNLISSGDDRCVGVVSNCTLPPVGVVTEDDAEAAGAVTATCGFNAAGSDNFIGYWGQNSAGAANPTNKALWEGTLASYCADTTYDLINIGFLNIFFDASNPGSLPSLNLAFHCETTFSSAPGLLSCPDIGKDIQTCQASGKHIVLSLGGAAGSYGFTSHAQAVQLATNVWKMFLGGSDSSIPRPFGAGVKLDGVDLDIEGGSNAYYSDFVTALRGMFSSDASKSYHISACPQCVYPDAYVGPGSGTALGASQLDFVQIQFYNNWCGVQNYANQYAWNFNDWATWARSATGKPKLILGVPASATAAGTGYIATTALKTIISDLRVAYADVFGGVMIWDVSQAALNVVGGQTFAQTIASFLHASRTSCTSPSPTPTAKPTAAPTATPTAAPTATPTAAPTAKPTASPSASPTAKPTSCGDGVCAATECCDTCPQDCGPCAVICGDGYCDAPTETCTTCPWDCRTNCGGSSGGAASCAAGQSGLVCSPKDCCAKYIVCSNGASLGEQATAPGTICYQGQLVFPSDARCAGVTC